MFARPDRLVNWQCKLFPDVPWLGSPWRGRSVRAQGAAIIVIFAFFLTWGSLAERGVPQSAQVIAAVLVSTATLGALLFLWSSSK